MKEHPQGRMMDARELGSLLGVAKSSIWSWDSSGKIPQPIRIGGCTRWSRPEVERWLDAGAPPRVKWNARKGVRNA